MITHNKCGFLGRAHLCGRAVGGAAVALSLVCANESFAQEAHFGIAPAANTQRAISDPPTQSTREEDGLYASVGVGYSHRSNVRRDETDQGDSAWVITPEAGYKQQLGRHSAEVGVTTQFTRFEDFEDENANDYTVRALTNLDLTQLLNLDLFGSFTDASEPRGGSGTRFVQDLDPDEVEITRYGGVFTIGRRESRIQVQAGADRSQWRYQNNQQEFRDRDDDTVRGRVYYNISPRTSVFAGARLTDIDYIRQGTTNDSEELGYEVGGRWDVTAQTTGQVSIGQTEKDFDNPALEDADATTFGGRLSWSPRPRTTLNFYGSRQFEESNVASDDYFISDLIGASISQDIGSRWGAFAYINSINDEYESGQEDDILDYGFGLDYALAQWLSIGAQYSIIERDSNVPSNDYEDEVLSLFLNGSLQFGTR